MTGGVPVSAVEAVLFAGGEPVELGRLCEVFGAEPPAVRAALTELEQRLEGSGIRLVRMGDAYQLATRKEYAETVAAAFDLKRKQPLSQAGFEVLAVVAYNQPVTRAFIEQVRGVDCSGVLAALVEKELIAECGRLDLPGRPLLYETTPVFLRCFGLNDLSELPPLPENAPEGETGAAGDGG